ncbi:hypothetical protein AB205_0008980 [Aquarana catesbeiana]|uniref:Uncharacterized protein n=1 Tax=Aquarana catesbeiana TaxID=8400 RepID=A0A2G9S0P9_AQUCT|nr:hypothetical protein AB205_0008980 [Aquarana catesbeiana]
MGQTPCFRVRFQPPAGPPGRQVCTRNTTSWSSVPEVSVAVACGWAQKPVWGLPQQRRNGPELSILSEEAGHPRSSQGRTRHGRIMQSAGLERGLVTRLEDAFRSNLTVQYCRVGLKVQVLYLTFISNQYILWQRIVRVFFQISLWQRLLFVLGAGC